MQIRTRKILIADPDEKAAAHLSEFLERQGFGCFTATDMRSALSLMTEEKFDAVISELEFADGRATDLLSVDCPPVVVLSASHGDDDIIGALSSGCADFVFKPCSPRVMAARLEARFSSKANAYEYHGLKLDLPLRQVTYLGDVIKLTSSEFEILSFLMANAGSFFSSDEIYFNVWHASSLQRASSAFTLQT